jgi:hypothetical protein
MIILLEHDIDKDRRQEMSHITIGCCLSLSAIPLKFCMCAALSLQNLSCVAWNLVYSFFNKPSHCVDTNEPFINQNLTRLVTRSTLQHQVQFKTSFDVFDSAFRKFCLCIHIQKTVRCTFHWASQYLLWNNLFQVLIYSNSLKGSHLI